MSSPPDIPLRQRIRRWLAAVLATLVIALAILVGLFRLLVPQISEYRDVIAQWAGDALGAPVEISEIDVRWRWLVPEVVLEDVIIRPEAEGVDPVQAGEIAIRVSPLDLIRPGPMRPGRVILRRGDFAVLRDREGRVRIPGVAVFDPAGQDSRDQNWRVVLADILANADYRVEDSRLRLRDEVLDLGPWDLRIAHTRLHSRADRHHYRSELQLPEEIGGHLRIDLLAEGDARHPENWDWQLDLDTEAARLGLLSDLLSWERLRPLQGGIRADLQLRGSGAAATLLRGDLMLDALEARFDEPALRPVGDESGSRHLVFEGIRWETERGGWRLQVRQLDLSPQGVRWPSSQLELRRRDQHLSGNLRYARIQDLASLMQEITAHDQAVIQWLDRLRPRGEVRDLLGEVRLEDGEPKDFSLRGRLTGIGMRSWERIPGFDGVNGWLRLNQDGGRMEIDAGPVHFDYPELFRERLSAERLQATVDWSRQGEGWRLESSDIRARNRDARATAELGLDIQPDQPVWIRLEADVPEARSDNLSDYLPVGRMPEATVAWLDEAIQAGVARNGRVLVDGPAMPFPYANDEGRFLVTFDVDDGRVDFEPGYPPLEGVSAAVRFEQAGMAIRARSGRIAGYRLRSAEARIPDVREPELELEGQASGGLADGLDFLRQSPLAEWFAAPLEPVRLDGQVDLELAMHIPLREAAELQLDGVARLAAGHGQVDWLPGEISELGGELSFTEEGARSDALTGRHLGHPFHVQVDPGSRGRQAAPDAERETVAMLRGGIDSERLRAAMPGYRMLDWLEGDFQWRGQVRVPNEPGQGDIQVILDSKLEGLAIAMPAPAGKTAETRRPLQVRFPVGSSHSRVDVDYGADLALSLNVAIPDEGAAHVRGLHVDVGQPRQVALPESGISVAGDIAELDGVAWLRVDWPVAAEADDDGLVLDAIDLRVGNLRAGRLQFENQTLNLLRRDEYWRLQLEGEDAEGELRLPLNVVSERATIRGALSRLNLRPLAADDAGAPVELNPLFIPSLDVQVTALMRDSRLLGAMDLAVMAVPGGVITERFSLSGTDMTAEMSAGWRLDPDGGQRGRLSGEVESRNVSAAMDALGFLPGIEAGFGRLEGNVSWRGSPGPDALRTLLGQVSVELRSGQLREVNPGAGRVFGLLSFSALPRRLYGDFRDVFGRGLRFDRVNGDFVLANGDAFTGNLKLEGPVANVELIGRTGLVSRDYDQRLRVETQVGSALPVAGAIAGGVGVGAAMLVISEVFRGPLSRMGRLEYRIDGSWDSPRVTPLDEAARRALDE